MRCIFLIIALGLQQGLMAQSKNDVSQLMLYSEHLDEQRLLQISLPVDYQVSRKKYPVLYLLDGEYIFEYGKGLIDFLSNPFGYIPKIILVSIPNTDRHRDLFVTLNEEDGYTNFIDFLEHEVMVLINEKYRSNGFNMIYGWSSASSISTYLLASRPDLFDGYIESGTGIGNRFAEFLSNSLTAHDYTNKYLYANTEGAKYLNTIGEGPRVAGFKKFANLIREINPDGLSWKFQVEEQMNHVQVMTKALESGLQFIFQDYYIPDSITILGAESVLSYYRKIDHNYDFNVEIPVGAVIEAALVLLQEDKIDECEKLLERGLEIHPKSADLLAAWAELYEYKGDNAGAANFYKRAMRQSLHDSQLHLKYQTLYQKFRN